MDGEFGKFERMSENPSKIVGTELFEALKIALPSQLNTDGLNHGSVYQNQNNGYRIHFFHEDGTELTTGNWLVLQDIAEQLFDEIKTKYQDRPEFESLELFFIDEDQDWKRKIVIKPRMQ